MVHRLTAAGIKNLIATIPEQRHCLSYIVQTVYKHVIGVGCDTIM